LFWVLSLLVVLSMICGTLLIVLPGPQRRVRPRWHLHPQRLQHPPRNRSLPLEQAAAFGRTGLDGYNRCVDGCV